MLPRPIARVDHRYPGHLRRPASPALLVVADEQKVVRVAVQDADAILEPLVLGVLLVTVDPVHRRPEQRRRHLERHPRARARLVEQVKEPLARQGLLELFGRRLLQLERRGKEDVLEPLARELASVQNVSKHATILADATKKGPWVDVDPGGPF